MSCAAFLALICQPFQWAKRFIPCSATNADVGTPAENAAQAETTGIVSAADVLSQVALQASFFYSREDRARFAGMDAKPYGRT